MQGQERGDNLYADYKMLQKFKGKEFKLFRKKNKVGRLTKNQIWLQSNNNNGSAILAQG